MVYYKLKDERIDAAALTKYLYDRGVLCIVNSQGNSRFVMNPYVG